nr:hypothetical protein CFP56_46840 [Quercus suber]POE87641.1 hypothetical protein CFP56_30230 [Quercus suber]
MLSTNGMHISRSGSCQEMLLKLGRAGLACTTLLAENPSRRHRDCMVNLIMHELTNDQLGVSTTLYGSSNVIGRSGSLVGIQQPRGLQPRQLYIRGNARYFRETMSWGNLSRHVRAKNFEGHDYRRS